MARQTTPVPSPTLAADHVTVKALQGMSDYQPVNPAYSTAQLLQHQASLAQTEQAAKAAEVALAQARKAQAEASHVYHDAVVGARAQVVALYGPDATAVALVGLTRKSERKRPVKRQTPA
jgi:hypothetical protein